MFDPKRCWIKCPGPGEFRGEGTWKNCELLALSKEQFRYYKDSRYLPTFEGDAPPSEA